jgi:hypothetical protein
LGEEASDDARALLRKATESVLPPVLAWLGTADEAARTMVDLGVTDPGTVLAAAFRDRVRDVLATAGVDVDAASPASEWDESRGRGPGHPEADAVERARGDRNRMLFVE